jgi:ABC-type antimicrobial peptide transport system permease subunit
LRVALGGAHPQVIGLFVREGMRSILTGVLIGAVVAAGLTQLMRSFLFELSPLDPGTYALAVAVFGTVGFLSCWLPARRVFAVDPMVALRGAD